MWCRFLKMLHKDLGYLEYFMSTSNTHTYREREERERERLVRKKSLGQGTQKSKVVATWGGSLHYYKVYLIYAS